MQKHSITHADLISIQDILKQEKRFSFQKKNSRSPVLGLVQIYQNGKLNRDQSEDGWLTNMTIASGREFINQAIFKKHSQSSIFGNVSDYKVDAFGVGSGGSTIDISENITLNGPSLFDIGLYKPIQINSQCLPSIRNSDPSTQIENVVKFIESTGAGNMNGSIEFETSRSSEFTGSPYDYYTVTKLTCIIEPQEPSFLNPGESVKIDEAMLFATSPTNTNPLPFAHICFSPKYIELEAEFTILWYIIA